MQMEMENGGKLFFDLFVGKTIFNFSFDDLC